VNLEHAREVAISDPLPPKLKELEQCKECWEAVEAGLAKKSHAVVQERAAPAEPVVAAKPAGTTVERLDSDDEF